MKLILLSIGKTDDKRLADLTAEYAAKINHYIPFSLEVLPDIKNTRSMNAQKQKKAEGEKILSYIKPGDELWLLDENGREYSSVGFSDFMQKRMNAGTRGMIFSIGGPYGFSDEVYAKAVGKVSLSKMTLTHQMVRLFATEQIYRAMSILRNEPYHHR